MIIDMTLTRQANDDTTSAVATEIFDALRGMVVDLTGVQNIVPGDDLYVLRVDSDGDVVVCELEHGRPQTNVTYAIPQANIARVRVRLGDDA